MSNLALTLEPEFGLEESIDFRTLVTEMEDGTERTRAKWQWGLRNYRLRLFAYSKSSMDTVWNFYIARKGAFDPWLVKIPTEYQVVNEDLTTGGQSPNGIRTIFTLDEFPVDTSTATFSMKVDGTKVTATLSNNFATEFSYVTFASAPAKGTALLGSYDFYFRVRFLNDRLTRSLIAYQLLNAGIEIKEKRWTYYRPRAGRTGLIFGSVSDSISVTEYEEEYKFRLVSESEAISITESQTFFSWINASDSVSITEGLAFSPIRVNVNDTLTIADIKLLERSA